MTARPPTARGAPQRAIVLGGGGARGAYEAGVLRYLLGELPAQLGHAPRIDLVTGTSVGAIHACFLAATAHLGPERGERLASLWSGLSLDDLFGSAFSEVLRLPRRMLGLLRTPSGLRSDHPPDRLDGLLDTRGLERVVLRALPWRQIRTNLQQDRMQAIGLTATEIATGRVVTFLESRDPGEPSWSGEGSLVARRARIGPPHALASAAIPFLFPAVRVGETYYADGGLRLNTPLSPALRLGADRVLVIALREGAMTGKRGDLEAGRIEQYGNPLFLFGKVLNALLLDHVESDLGRLQLVNDVLRRVRDDGGADLLQRINEAVAADRGQPYKIVEQVVVRPSQDLGLLAADVVHGERGRGRVSAPLRVLLRVLGIGDEPFEADLLSYLFFDASYTRALLELGLADARSMQAELLRFFED